MRSLGGVKDIMNDEDKQRVHPSKNDCNFVLNCITATRTVETAYDSQTAPTDMRLLHRDMKGDAKLNP